MHRGHYLDKPAGTHHAVPYMIASIYGSALPVLEELVLGEFNEEREYDLCRSFASALNISTCSGDKDRSLFGLRLRFA